MKVARNLLAQTATGGILSPLVRIPGHEPFGIVLMAEGLESEWALCGAARFAGFVRSDGVLLRGLQAVLG